MPGYFFNLIYPPEEMVAATARGTSSISFTLNYKMLSSTSKTRLTFAFFYEVSSLRDCLIS